MRTEELIRDWNKLVEVISAKFADGAEMDVDGILFIVGVQESNRGYKKYKKHEKVDLIHVAICTLLEPYGYYVYEGEDEQGWPHFKSTEKLPFLKAGEQSLLIKEALVNYAKANGLID